MATGPSKEFRGAGAEAHGERPPLPPTGREFDRFLNAYVSECLKEQRVMNGGDPAKIKVATMRAAAARQKVVTLFEAAAPEHRPASPAREDGIRECVASCQEMVGHWRSLEATYRKRGDTDALSVAITQRQAWESAVARLNGLAGEAGAARSGEDRG